MTAKFWGKWDIITLAIAVACILAAFLLGGCKHGKGGEIIDKRPGIPSPALTGPAAAPTVGKFAAVEPVAKTIKEADDREGEAIAQVHFWQAKVEVAHEEAIRLRDQERRAWLESACRWVMGLCWAGIFANGALFAASFVWPWFARLRYVALAGAGVALVLLVIAWNLPACIGWAGAAVAVAIGLSAVAFFLHTHSTGRLGHEARSVLARVKELAQ